MGIVTDIRWTCPECGHKNISQAWEGGDESYESWSVPNFFASNLKYNEPCENCKNVKLREYKGYEELVTMQFERINND